MSWSVSFSGGKEEVLADLASVRRAVDAAADHVSASNAQRFSVSLSGHAGDSSVGVGTNSSLQTGAQGQQAGEPASQQASAEPAQEEPEKTVKEPQAQADGDAGGGTATPALSDEEADEHLAVGSAVAPQQLSPNQIIQGTLTQGG